MMKYTLRFGLLALLVILFGSCGLGSLADTSTGSITFAFPADALSRGITDTYKVVIYYGLDRYDVAPTVADNELTFTAIPTGDVRIIVARGTLGTDGFFYTKDYGQLFITIVAGDNGPYNLDLEPSEFVWVDDADLKGANVNGLAALDGTLYVSTSALLKEVEISFGGGVIDGPAVPAGVTVNSLSMGKAYNVNTEAFDPQVWVNGTWSEASGGGIMPWMDGYLNESFSSGFGNPEHRQDGVLSSLSVSYSGAFEAADVSGDGLAIMFQRDGGIGGVYLHTPELVEPDYYGFPWIVDEINFDELLSDVAAEGTQFLKDFVVSPSSSAAYIVTSLMTVKVSEDIITSDTALTSADQILSSDSVAFAPYLGSDNVCIDLGGRASAEKIYVGTKNGLYSGDASATASEFVDGSGSLVTGTAGYSVKLIAVSPDPGTMVAFVANRGTNPDLLIIINNNTGAVADFRGLQGLPGTRLSNLVWLDGETLAVSGDHGVATIDAGALF